ncbi:unnamed protein product, partial [Phaeothamnion confervicola]
MERHYLPALFSLPGAAVIAAVAACLLAAGLAGLVLLPMGLEPQLAAPADSYLQSYYNDQFALGEAGPPAYAVMRDIDYYAAGGNGGVGGGGGGGGLRALSSGLARLRRYVQPPVFSWFDAMASWVAQRDTLGGDCPIQPDIVDQPSFAAATRIFLGIAIDSQCCQSFGVCGAHNDSSLGSGDSSGGSLETIVASRLRFNTQPLRRQRDFVRSAYALRRAAEILGRSLPLLQITESENSENASEPAFAYSLYFVYYEQYEYIRGVCLQSVALALGGVFLVAAFLADAATAAIVAALVLLVAVDTVGIVWLWGTAAAAAGGSHYAVSINAVSAVNLVMAVGLAVEFCLHIAVAFRDAPGTRRERARAAMRARGASVLTGITLTKLVGVSVLAVAPSQLFRLYYFRMYCALVAAGAFNGLAVLPLVLSRWGPE